MGFLILDNRAYYRGKTISRWDKFVVTIWNFVSCWKFGHDVIGWIGGEEEEYCSCCMHCSYQAKKCDVHDKEI